MEFVLLCGVRCARSLADCGSLRTASMSPRTLIPLISFVFLGSLLQFGALSASRYLGWVAGISLAILLPLSVRAFRLPAMPTWAAIFLPVAASLAGVGLFLAGAPQTADWTLLDASAFAAMTAAGMIVLGRVDSQRCGLCRRRIGRGVALTCPRCAMVVCEDCWRFDSLSCRLCEEQGVPVLSSDGRWWDLQLGPRLDFGRCQLCLTEAAETDLRACRNCSRAQCRNCWDHANGQCSRCKWIIADLPPALGPLMKVSEEHAPSRIGESAQ